MSGRAVSLPKQPGPLPANRENFMKNYKLTIQYDGTRYRGWQIQNGTDATVQGKIQDVLTRLEGRPVELTGSGRTDAGVHALGQVANVHLEEHYTCEEIRDYLNRYLPEDIAVTAVEEAEERFHSRYHALSKTYLYRIHTGEIPNVFERKYMYSYQKPLEVSRMRQAAGYLVGTHDFKAFCGNKKMKKSTVRSLYEIRIEEIKEEVRIYYTGNGFLQNMVRILTGTLIETGDGRREPEEMLSVLEGKNREAAGYTAPACGLTLYQVTYGKEH